MTHMRRKPSRHEQELLLQIKGACLPHPVEEYSFHPARAWRLDFAWPAELLAIEIHGGVHVQGRHTRGRGFIEDRTKMNEALLLGWRVLEVTPEHLKSGLALHWLCRAFGRETPKVLIPVKPKRSKQQELFGP